MSLLQRNLEQMQETKGNSENTPAIYDWLLDLCEISETGPSKIVTDKLI